jgi:hypothetical protein
LFRVCCSCVQSCEHGLFVTAPLPLHPQVCGAASDLIGPEELGDDESGGVDIDRRARELTDLLQSEGETSYLLEPAAITAATAASSGQGKPASRPQVSKQQQRDSAKFRDSFAAWWAALIAQAPVQVRSQASGVGCAM